MRTNAFPKMFLLAACVFIPTSLASAQDTKTADPPSDVQQSVPNQQQDVRGNMIRQLGLSREQLQQIRRMNRERKPLMDEAQRHFREANRALNEAIYADQVNDADVQARLKEVQLAQAEIQRLRYTNELAVRRVLTPDQLTRFREMRERFEQAREDLEKRRPFTNGQATERPPTANDLRQPVINQSQSRPAARPARQKPAQPKPNQ